MTWHDFGHVTTWEQRIICVLCIELFQLNKLEYAVFSLATVLFETPKILTGLPDIVRFSSREPDQNMLETGKFQFSVSDIIL